MCPDGVHRDWVYNIADNQQSAHYRWPDIGAVMSQRGQCRRNFKTSRHSCGPRTCALLIYDSAFSGEFCIQGKEGEQLSRHQGSIARENNLATAAQLNFCYVTAAMRTDWY